MLQSERLVSSWLVIGAHVGPQTLYGEVRVRIPGLQIWIGLSGIRKTIVNKTDSSPASFIYQVEGLAEEIIDIPGLSAILGWGSGANCSGDLITDIAVKMSAYLRIQSAAPKDLDWYFQQMGKTTTLLSFLAGSPMASDQISAKVAKSGAEVEVLVALREAKYCQYRNGHEFFCLEMTWA